MLEDLFRLVAIGADAFFMLMKNEIGATMNSERKRIERHETKRSSLGVIRSTKKAS